jgi:hypothetical protein
MMTFTCRALDQEPSAIRHRKVTATIDDTDVSGMISYETLIINWMPRTFDSCRPWRAVSKIRGPAGKQRRRGEDDFIYHFDGCRLETGQVS